MWVAGVPPSLAASTRTQDRWKERIQFTTRPLLPEGHFLSSDPIKVTVFYFPDAPMEGDLDNILKPILDSWNRLIYLDDQQVDHIVVRKFEPDRIDELASLSPEIEGALLGERPGVYLRVEASTEDVQ